MDDPVPLTDRYWYIRGRDAKRIDVPVPKLWQQLTSGAPSDPIVREVADGDGWLISTYEMSSDMDSSEMHPEGDEWHYLVSGELDLVLEGDDGDRALRLQPGTSAVVPRGVWHRFAVHEPGVGIAITCGRGTRHRQRA